MVSKSVISSSRLPVIDHSTSANINMTNGITPRPGRRDQISAAKDAEISAALSIMSAYDEYWNVILQPF
ncbi:MAG: hypothetical protein Q9P44_21220 [Anaerolineae bacterium]|nr:hypothetical protein [Anaerolineae bacterium]